jgi:hypothetical protein
MRYPKAESFPLNPNLFSVSLLEDLIGPEAHKHRRA